MNIIVITTGDISFKRIFFSLDYYCNHVKINPSWCVKCTYTMTTGTKSLFQNVILPFFKSTFDSLQNYESVKGSERAEARKYVFLA
jgi:hypothetical protein